MTAGLVRVKRQQAKSKECNEGGKKLFLKLLKAAGAEGTSWRKLWVKGKCSSRGLGFFFFFFFPLSRGSLQYYVTRAATLRHNEGVTQIMSEWTVPATLLHFGCAKLPEPSACRRGRTSLSRVLKKSRARGNVSYFNCRRACVCVCVAPSGSRDVRNQQGEGGGGGGGGGRRCHRERAARAAGQRVNIHLVIMLPVDLEYTPSAHR